MSASTALLRRIEALEAQARQRTSMVAGTAPTVVASDASTTGPSWIDPVDVGSGGSSTSSDWTTVDVRALGGPEGASAAIVEFAYRISKPDGAESDESLTANAYARPDSAGPVYMIGKGRSSEASDNVAGFSQSLVRLSLQGAFDFQVPPPGFNIYWKLRVVGWFA